MSDSLFDRKKSSATLASKSVEESTLDEAEVFANALDLVDVEARNRYLDRMLGTDSERRQRLDRLLTYSSSTSDFLETSPAESTKLDGAHLEAVGDWLGPYRLLEQIGEGGMGSVFMAEQTSPLQRRVAIKVIKPGMDSSQVLARFEAERQVLAMMEHPNIARAIDVGVSSLGRTYFVMELVRGLPITRYCDDLQLNMRQRLELFVPVCLAIQHAHQKGIIHRDLKPSNILVAEYDGVAVPKIIDFGVAKALNQQVSCKTHFTQCGQIVGTLQYMSPEQSRINQLDIDTRSDIYSLGVLLYELITGTTPIQSQQLKDLSWDELVRFIREEDAPAPSQRLSKIERIELVAQQRHSQPSQLRGNVKGELDWIVLKALDKQRSRRYQNATELADDVRRFLRGDEVLACPPSTAYRLRKYVQRHKFSLVAGGLVLTAVLLGLAATSWQAWQASIARRQAEEQRDNAKAEALRAQQAQALAKAEAKKSEQEAQITRAVASFVNNDLIAFADPNLEPNRNIRLREIVDRASEKIAALGAAPLVEASIRFTLAKSYLGLGEYRAALEHAEASWRIRSEQLAPDDRDSLASQLLVAEAQLKLSRFQAACATYRQAMKTSDLLLVNHPTIQLDCQHGYAVALAKLGKLDEGIMALEQVAAKRRKILGATHMATLETDRELAQLMFQRGDYREAAQAIDSVLTVMVEHLGKSHPVTLKTMADAANVAAELGETSEARRKRELILEHQTQVLGAEHPDALLTASNLTLVSQRLADPVSGTAKNLELLKVAHEKLGPSHAVSISIASTLADILNEYGKSKEATGYLRDCQAALQKSQDEKIPELLRIQCQLAGCYAFDGQYQAALALYQQTLEEQRALLSAKHLDTLKTEYGYAVTLMTAGNFSQAEKCLLNLIEVAESGDLKHHPLVQLAQSKLATLESVLGRAACLERHQAACQATEAKYGRQSRIALQQQVAYAETLIRFGRNSPAKQILEDGLAILDDQEGATLLTRGQFQAALIEVLVSSGDFSAAEKLSRELYREREAALGKLHPLTIRGQSQLGAILVSSGDPTRGVVHIREAMERSRENFGAEFPLTLNYQQNLASTLGLLAISDRSKRREALKLYEELLAIQISWGVDHPDWLFTQLGYAGALGQQGRWMQAERVFEGLLPKLVTTYGDSHPFVMRLRENYSSILGSLGKYPKAIEQCRSCLRTQALSLPTRRKLTHAAIEYYIDAGDVMAGWDLFESAFQIASESEAELSWLYQDIPFYVDALYAAGEDEKAKKVLRDAVSLFSGKLGHQHPKTWSLGAKLLALYARQRQPHEAALLIKELEIQAQTTEGYSGQACAEMFADIAKRFAGGQSIQAVSLCALAAQACRDQLCLADDGSLPEKAEAKESESAAEIRRQADGDKYQELAVKVLSACAEKGMLQSVRARRWLSSCRELDILRDREDFEKVVAEVEMSAELDKTMRQAWNLATVDERRQAELVLEQFAQQHPELAELGGRHYLTARVWAACYESAERQNQAEEATDYLARCSSSLQRCLELGYFEKPEHRLILDEDDSFTTLRTKLPLSLQ